VFENFITTAALTKKKTAADSIQPPLLLIW